MEENKNNVAINDTENRLTQKRIVISYLIEHGEMPMPVANFQYGITRLGAIIWELRNEGWDIITEKQSGIHQTTGNYSTWANYKLKATPAV